MAEEIQVTDIIQSIKGKEYILLSYPFRSMYNANQFEKRCLGLGGIVQGANVNNSRDIANVNILLPTEKIDDFKRLESEDEARESSSISGITPIDLAKSMLKVLGVAVGMIIAFSIIYLFIRVAFMCQGGI